MKKILVRAGLFITLFAVVVASKAMEKGEILEKQHEQKKTPKQELLEAINSGDLKKTSTILTINPKLLNAPLKNGYGALHWAVNANQEEIFDYLLSLPNINPNIRATRTRKTPLHLAAASNNIKLLKKLCSHPKIKINARNHLNQTPLHYAARCGHVEIIKFFCSLPNIDTNATDSLKCATPLLNTVESGSLEAVKSLCACSKVELLLTDPDGHHPIHTAAGNNLPEIIEFFVTQNRVLLDIENNFGNTPLHTASYFGNCESIAVLIKHGASPDAVTKETKNQLSQTPLAFSLRMGHYAAATLLIKLGAKMTAAIWTEIRKKPKEDFRSAIDALVTDVFVERKNMKKEYEWHQFYKSIYNATKNKQDKNPLTGICKAYIGLITTANKPLTKLSKKEIALGKKYFKFPPKN